MPIRPVVRLSMGLVPLVLSGGVLLAFGCQQGDPPMGITVRSESFTAGGPIPKRHTEDGEDLSPQLSWEGAPETTKEFALICDDPDAPTPQPWVHWVIYKIPADLQSLPEGIAPDERPAAPAGALQGTNSWSSGQTIGYRGPAPPSGVHHYHFKIYALDAPLDVGPGLNKQGLMKAMQGHVLAEGDLIGTYQR